AAAATATLLARLGLVDGQGAAVDLRAVQRGDGLVAAAGHLDEAEAARAAGLAVGRHLGPRHLAKRLEELAEVLLRRLEGEVADVDVLAHRLPSRAPPAVTDRRTRPGGRWRLKRTDVVRCPVVRLDDLGSCEARERQVARAVVSSDGCWRAHRPPTARIIAAPRAERSASVPVSGARLKSRRCRVTVSEHGEQS